MGSTMLFRTLIKLSRRVLLQCRVLHKCWYSLAHKSSVFKRALVGGTGCTLRHFTQWSHVTCCVFLYSRLSMKLTPINRPITKTLYCRVMHETRLLVRNWENNPTMVFAGMVSPAMLEFWPWLAQYTSDCYQIHQLQTKNLRKEPGPTRSLLLCHSLHVHGSKAHACKAASHSRWETSIPYCPSLQKRADMPHHVYLRYLASQRCFLPNSPKNHRA